MEEQVRTLVERHDNFEKAKSFESKRVKPHSTPKQTIKLVNTRLMQVHVSSNFNVQNA